MKSKEPLSLQCWEGVREATVTQSNHRRTFFPFVFQVLRKSAGLGIITPHTYKYSSCCVQLCWSHKEIPELPELCGKEVWMLLRESTVSGFPRLLHLCRQLVQDMRSSEQAAPE